MHWRQASRQHDEMQIMKAGTLPIPYCYCMAANGRDTSRFYPEDERNRPKLQEDSCELEYFRNIKNISVSLFITYNCYVFC